MRYYQVDHALAFLVEPNDGILIQVPRHSDIDLVQRHIIRRMGNPLSYNRRNRMVYPPRQQIYFQSIIGNENAGIGFRTTPTFLIDRASDSSWMDWLRYS